MLYLRPSKSTRSPLHDALNILENIENCSVAQYITQKQGNNDFVKRGSKTELGLHLETCDICLGRRDSEPISQVSISADKSAMYEISDFAVKRAKSWGNSKGIDPKNISLIVEAMLLDVSARDELIQALRKENNDWKERYETLKTIKANSANRILFPQQKQVTKESMLSKKAIYLGEELKKADLEIVRLKRELESVYRTNSNIK